MAVKRKGARLAPVRRREEPEREVAEILEAPAAKVLKIGRPAKDRRK